MYIFKLRLHHILALIALFALLPTGAGQRLQAAGLPSRATPQAMPPASRLYGTVGLGFINIDRGVGVDIPFGFTAVLPRYRLIGTVNPLDLGLLEGKNQDPRYYRPYPGSAWCIDSKTDLYVPGHYCSGGTDALLSAAVDLSYIVFEEVWISDRPGALFAGIGCRLFKPQTFYGTVGLYFLSQGRRAGSFKLALGKQYVNLGVVWGFDLLHRFRRGSRQAYRRQFVQRVLRSG